MGPEPSGEIDFDDHGQKGKHGVPTIVNSNGSHGEPPWLIQLIERLEYLESKAEATRRAEEAARAATKEAKEATRRAEDASDKCEKLIRDIGRNGLSAVTENQGKGADVWEELDGLKRAQKRLQDELLSKATQISSMSMAQEDAFRSLNMLAETCRSVKAESERTSADVQGIQVELRKGGSLSNIASGASLDTGLIDKLRHEIATMQQQLASTSSSSTQQIQQIQKNVGSIVDFAEKASSRQDATAKEISDIKQHLSNKGNAIPVSPPAKKEAPRTSGGTEQPAPGGLEALRKDVEELAMAMGEVAGRFSNMEQDITQAFASCARAVDVKEIENHFISRSSAIEDKVATLGKQLGLIKDGPAASSPTHPRQSEGGGYIESERGSPYGSRDSHPLLSATHPPQGPGGGRAWGTPQGQPGMMPMGMQPMVPVQVMPMYQMQPGMMQFGARASPSSAHLGAMMKQGMMQQAQASAGRFSRGSNDGAIPQFGQGDFMSGPSVSQPSKVSHPSNRVRQVKPDEAAGRERMQSLQSFSRPLGDNSSPLIRSAPGPTSGPLTSNPPAAPFLSRLQEGSGARNSADGRLMSSQQSSPSTGSSQNPGPPQFLDESMMNQMQQMMNGQPPHHGYGK